MRKFTEFIEVTCAPDVPIKSKSVSLRIGNTLMSVGLLAPAVIAQAGDIVPREEDSGYVEDTGALTLFGYSTSKILIDNHPLQLIGSGVARSLSTAELKCSLLENAGDRLPRKEMEKYLASMGKFSSLTILDSYVEYLESDRMVRTCIVLQDDFTLSLTFFQNRARNDLAFSLDYKEENIVTGIGNAAEIAEAVTGFLTS